MSFATESTSGKLSAPGLRPRTRKILSMNSTNFLLPQVLIFLDSCSEHRTLGIYDILALCLLLHLQHDNI